jgi:hypothetical protein
MQGFPFWQDWGFWEIVVTGISALLGFLGGTLVHHRLERRRERLRDREEACVLAAALHAEVSTMRAKAMQLLGLLGQSSGVPVGGYEIGRAIGIPRPIIFERNARRLGTLTPDFDDRTLIDTDGETPSTGTGWDHAMSLRCRTAPRSIPFRPYNLQSKDPPCDDNPVQPKWERAARSRHCRHKKPPGTTQPELATAMPT